MKKWNQTVNQLFYLLQQNCLLANYLCGENACSKDVHSKDAYGENSRCAWIDPKLSFLSYFSNVCLRSSFETSQLHFIICYWNLKFVSSKFQKLISFSEYFF